MVKRIVDIGIITTVRWFLRAVFQRIIVVEPLSFQQVGAKFRVSGWVPESLINDSKRLDNRLSIEYIDLDGKIFAGMNIDVFKYQSRLFEKYLKIYLFNDVLELVWINTSWIEKSQGRMVLRIYGNDKKRSVFIPLVVPQFIPPKLEDHLIVKKHLGVGRRILKYENDYKEYAKKLNKLFKREIRDFENNFEVDNKDWVEVEEDEKLDQIAYMLYNAESDEKRKLDKKYEDVLKWMGPLCRGIAGRMGGYSFKVYSNDHGSHFHVIHCQQKVDARFSFPEIQLINYKNKRNIIGSKEIKQIQEFFKNKQNFKRLEEEFNKRNR